MVDKHNRPLFGRVWALSADGVPFCRRLACCLQFGETVVSPQRSGQAHRVRGGVIGESLRFGDCERAIGCTARGPERAALSDECGHATGKVTWLSTECRLSFVK
eukprot:scaffold196669_cov28-Tisochrysis_lutea.AAC.2